MSRQEAQAELAARWGAPTLMRAAVEEYVHVRDWLPPLSLSPQDFLNFLTRRRNDGGKAA